MNRKRGWMCTGLSATVKKLRKEPYEKGLRVFEGEDINFYQRTLRKLVEGTEVCSELSAWSKNCVQIAEVVSVGIWLYFLSSTRPVFSDHSL